MDKIDALIANWQLAQNAYVAAREEYRAAWAKALLASDNKTESGRKAQADAATSDIRLVRDNLETKAAAAWQLLIATRGPVEASEMPGRHFEAA